MNRSQITAERLRELLSYSAETGEFIWLVKRGPKRAGSDAGSINIVRGYREIGIDHTIYLAHRLAWLYVYGRWPTLIDHRNRNRSDNRISNLREITIAENTQNTSIPSSNNKVGVLGVSRCGKRYRAQITIDRKNTNLGRFSTLQEAEEVYLSAKRRLHPFFETEHV